MNKRGPPTLHLHASASNSEPQSDALGRLFYQRQVTLVLFIAPTRASPEESGSIERQKTIHQVAYEIKWLIFVTIIPIKIKQ